MATNKTCWWSKDTVAVVTGANRGIGLEIVRLLAKQGLTVVLTSRDHRKGELAVHTLRAEGLESVAFHQLEVNDAQSVKKLATWLGLKFGGIDILVNNAAVLGDSLSYEAAQDVIGTNYYGTRRITEALLPLLRASPAGARIVNVTSRSAFYESLEDESLEQILRDEKNYNKELPNILACKYLEALKADYDEGRATKAKQREVYKVSKLLSYIFSVSLSKLLSKLQPEDHQIFVASFCPGVTQTDMLDLWLSVGYPLPKGYTAKTAAEGADNGIWLALMPKEELLKRHGKCFWDKREYSRGPNPQKTRQGILPDVSVSRKEVLPSSNL